MHYQRIHHHAEVHFIFPLLHSGTVHLTEPVPAHAVHLTVWDISFFRMYLFLHV